MLLERFATPGNQPEPTPQDADAWSATVQGLFAGFPPDEFPQFYDPTKVDTPHTATVASVTWAAFPADLLREATSQEGRWGLADSSRDLQDEYCEWSVERRDGKVVKVTFTSEVPEYWEHMARTGEARVVDLYHQLVDPSIDPGDLFPNGAYDINNPHNIRTDGPIAHLRQGNNFLSAAIALAGTATILREQDGVPVTTKQRLGHCAGLGNPLRNSDPQIAIIVNDAARSGAEVTFADPPGLYLDGLSTNDMVTPDGADPASFWTVERGDADHVVRASFVVPPEAGYAVGDILLAGRPIAFGAQLADRVTVRLDAVVKPGEHHPQPVPCKQDV